LIDIHLFDYIELGDVIAARENKLYW